MPVSACLHESSETVMQVLHGSVGLLCIASLVPPEDLRQFCSLIYLQDDSEEVLCDRDVVFVESGLSQGQELGILCGTESP